MKETTLNLLFYAREFFVRGERELDENTNISYMQAILKFHDATEFCIRAIIEEFSINHDRNMDFASLIKCVNKHDNTKQLPLASQMDFLNSTRGKIKHHASIPSFDDTQRCKRYTRDFLDKSVRKYLNESFFEIQRVLLIENKNVLNHLKIADKNITEANYLEALIEIKKAFLLAQPSYRTFVSKDSFFSGFFLTTGFREIEELQKPIERIVNKVVDLEERVALLMMGIDALKLQRFEDITPHLMFVMAEKGCVILWDDSVSLTREIAEEAMTYVVDMALLWQKRGVIANRPERSKRIVGFRRQWKEVRRDDWSPYEPNAEG